MKSSPAQRPSSHALGDIAAGSCQYLSLTLTVLRCKLYRKQLNLPKEKRKGARCTPCLSTLTPPSDGVVSNESLWMYTESWLFYPRDGRPCA